VLTVTNATSRDIQQHYGVDDARVHVTGNGVDPIFRPEENPARLAVVRERYKLPDRFILAVGAERPQKSLETLVDAFAYLDPAVAPALVIAGEVDARFADGVGYRVDAHCIASRVVRPGFIHEADLPALYTLADVLAFPSVAEGFGLPPLEAMACGTPVVAASSSAVSEVVADAALTFNPCDARALAQRLADVLTDAALRSALTERGRKRADAFTWERVAEATLQGYALIESRAKATCVARRTIEGRRRSTRPLPRRDHAPR
jgi:alpha-1,3-rhamnosyl/mannosyltransferase